MKIIVGSENKAKILAVEESLKQYPMFRDSEVSGIDADSEVGEQPMSLDETWKGAQNRAINAWECGPDQYDYAFGIEDGIVIMHTARKGTVVPTSEYFSVSVCSIWNGSQHYTGMSSIFEYPSTIVDGMGGLDGGDIRQSCIALGLAKDREDFDAQGACVGMLTGGKVPRQAYAQEGIRNALMHIVRVGDVYEKLERLQ